MKPQVKGLDSAEALFVGIDMHKVSWHVTIRTADVEPFSGSIPGRWEVLRMLLHRYRGSPIQVVYEAGCFGFWLHDRLIEHGVDCMITPPSLIPRESGNRVKTDRKDSRKLAHFLAKGLLKRIFVPSKNDLIHELSEMEPYRERVRILTSVPGIGTVAAMELLLELQDVARFRQADQLAAYVGLKPAQYSSTDKVRMVRITKVGKHSLRAVLVQVAWQLIRKDGSMKERYERIKIRSGGKRAIVAIARTLLLRVRRIWLDATPYRLARLDPFSAPFAA
ncbi:MAG: transposase [Syntrophobacteraceae bacterium]|jgi:transposase